MCTLSVSTGKPRKSHAVIQLSRHRYGGQAPISSWPVEAFKSLSKTIPPRSIQNLPCTKRLL